MYLLNIKKIVGQLQCWLEFTEQWHWQLYMTVVSISLFIIPAAIITSCYTIIITTLWKKNTMTIAATKRNDQGKTISLGISEIYIFNESTLHKITQCFFSGFDNSKRVSSRGLIPRAKIKTIKITLVIVTGKFFFVSNK